MEKYIKINTPIQYHGGWSSSATMLNINSYTITKNVIVNQSSTAPMVPTTDSTITVNYSLFKDYPAFNNNESPAQPKNFLWNITKQIESDVVEDIYDLVLTELTTKDFDCEIVTL